MTQMYKTKIFKQFVPFMLLVIGGSFLVREFTKIRYKYRRVTTYDLTKDTEAAGIKMKKPATLEEEYENTMKKIDIDNWENIRISRPWEETTDTK
ncbi:cytochrome c oxidase assembly protein COX16 homolog, mitochondrial [Osmia bicornis bicornis]|uniref:cytochrome c oxidase assembly protein COX16 homolog, mitochondrial n=1 Tax=Osmia bicornis bicornis TaxID=1437191 RepID=UPI0010F8DB58|nr:cytochrome c oxidase assembly protein COX16 homolog, mitochondrial [Osmia bicornis bicornis]